MQSTAYLVHSVSGLPFFSEYQQTHANHTMEKPDGHTSELYQLDNGAKVDVHHGQDGLQKYSYLKISYHFVNA